MNAPVHPAVLDMAVLRARQAFEGRRFENSVGKPRWWIVRESMGRTVHYTVSRSQLAGRLMDLYRQGDLLREEAVGHTGPRIHSYSWIEPPMPARPLVVYRAMSEAEHERYVRGMAS